MQDPIGRLAEEKLIELAIDVTVQLEQGTEMRPVLWLLVQARKRAADAMIKFLTIDPNDREAIRKLQNDINRYDDYVIDCRNLMTQAKEGYALITESERAEMADIIGHLPVEEQRLYGHEPEGYDA